MLAKPLHTVAAGILVWMSMDGFVLQNCGGAERMFLRWRLMAGHMNRPRQPPISLVHIRKRNMYSTLTDPFHHVGVDVSTNLEQAGGKNGLIEDKRIAGFTHRKAFSSSRCRHAKFTEPLS